jgi:hypothetical protein
MIRFCQFTVLWKLSDLALAIRSRFFLRGYLHSALENFLYLTKHWFLVSQMPASCLTVAMRVRNGSRFFFVNLSVLSKFDTMQGGVCLSGFFTVSAV